MKKTQKRKRTRFCLNSSLKKSNNISESNDIGKEMHIAKRQRISLNIENEIRTWSRTSVEERLSMPCNALKEQIKRFSFSNYIEVIKEQDNKILDLRRGKHLDK